jgi:hypothetical protein
VRKNWFDASGQNEGIKSCDNRYSTDQAPTAQSNSGTGINQLYQAMPLTERFTKNSAGTWEVLTPLSAPLRALTGKFAFQLLAAAFS